ncbi:MAG TPA: hypothetical protein VGY77_01465 [Gemmataceae bacterium]|nr:hypothetical protein [Gemmataceae bacterium]
MRLRFALMILCAAFLVFGTACAGSGGSGTISGTVTVNGQKLKRGLVTFLPENTKKGVFNAAIIEGKYEVSGVPVGLAKVVIIPALDPPGTGENPPEGNDGMVRPAVAPKHDDFATTVPAKYQDAATSSLELTVKSGQNDYDVNLTP